MSATVNILCPNGRRFNIKVAPNDTILQVLEKVCVKGNFNSNEYTLRHQRNDLDVTRPFRYANVPNLAKLEMVKLATPRAEGVVHIALQVESGQRLASDFKPDDSLLEILLHWDSQDENSHLAAEDVRDGVTHHPVCIYMRTEIVGEPWLKHTSLKSLGLTRGKAIIRHMHRATDLPPPPRVPVARPKQTPPSDPSRVTSPSQEPTSNIAPSPSDSVRNKEAITEQTLPATDNVNTSPIEPMDITDDKNTEKGEWKDDKMMDTEQPMDTGEGATQGKMVSFQVPPSSEDELMPQEQTLPSPLSGEEPAWHQQASSCEGAKSNQGETEEKGDQSKSSVESFLQSHGATGVSLDERTRLKIEKLMRKEEEMMKQMNEMAQQLRAQQVEFVRNQTAASSSKEQPANFKVPKNASSKKDVPSSFDTAEEDLSKPLDRRVLVFHSDDVVPAAEHFQDLPEDFFTVTADDMRSMLSDLKNQQSSERQLETKAMRDARMKKEMSRYSKVAVRIHFPDHLILQAFFRPGEKVGALYSFVEDCVNEKKSFYLYTTPPKTVLKDKTQTLFQAKLFPAALVYFGSEHSQDCYLSDSTLQKRVSLKEAEVSAFRESPSSSSQSSADLPSTSSGGASSYATPGPSQAKRKPTSASSGTANKSTSKGQVPKWFKIGRK